MRVNNVEGKTPATGCMARLARDKRGNTIAILAIALIPTAAFAGSAVDMTRLYVVRARLQQACDAGALAGRKVMVDDADDVLDTPARLQAETFFNNNFKNGWLGTRDTTKTYQESGTQQVTGAATTVVPMAIMGMFSMMPSTIAVKCAARLDVPDLDLMLVLDTTGSMACPPNGPSSCGQSAYEYTRSDGTKAFAITEASGSRIAGLRSAVLDFYDTIDTYTDDLTNVRYGIVPYSSTVNVGFQLPSNYIADAHDYSSRRIDADFQWGAITNETTTGWDRPTCEAAARRYPAEPLKFDTAGNATRKKFSSWSNARGGTCVLVNEPLIPMWRFGPKSATDTSRFKLKGQEVQRPDRYEDVKSRWQGCIEERSTLPATSFSPSSLPPDLDPDLKPTTDATKWKPMWPDQIVHRTGVAKWGPTLSDNYFPPRSNPENRSNDYYNIWADQNYVRSGYYTCGAPVRRLSATSRSVLSNYLTAPEFKPQGGTYHDVGMIWGTRLLSPTGPFASDTAPYPGRGEPDRHIIFMTDGEMAPNEFVYGTYGVEYWDNRVGGGVTDVNELKKRHNARFNAVCEAAKASPRNITVWVIGFGQTLNEELKNCSTAPWKDHAFEAKSEAELRAAFRKIAKQVGSLRVYQ